MEVHIFDVEHGNCAAILMPSGELMLIDCGHNSSTNWRPSSWIVQKYRGVISNLTISNFDEDHVSDLPNILAKCNVRSLSKNWNIDSNWIQRIKAQSGMGPGISALVNSIDNIFTGPPYITNWGGADVSRYCLSPRDFDDENSLSLVTFVHYKGIRIVFPGDLTEKAWLKLLINPEFRRKLGETNIFVASHHGRKDGYCKKVFDYCKPEVIIVSDKSIQHSTQQVDYSLHASGIKSKSGQVKKVLTTRKYGKIKIMLSGQDSMNFLILVG